ncbi:MAG: ferritin-like domain-containing protein [Nannocystaceae bacterium]
MTDFHEPWDALPAGVRDIHRAITSLKEELEAVDWYHQRVAACTDPQLQRILAHNRDEEIEHAIMTLEWLRRNMPGWDHNLRTYLFTEGEITELEKSDRGDKEAGDEGGRGLGLGRPSRPSPPK